MYAIVNISGKQFKVEQGDRLQVPLLKDEVGEIIQFDQVLLTDDGKSVTVGKPVVKNVKVEATILENGRSRKILVYKKKRRKGYQRKKGHRQDFSLIEIKKIQTAAPKKKASPKATKKMTDPPEKEIK
ncbi:MAG: 50S ribosomal protein L21 [Candidatus Neomarinimicrobiota bacterium]